jgi:nucleotide-binding universal stress UspA family protein
MTRPVTTVVGYDGSPTAQAALGFAAERGGPSGRVIAVYVATAPSTFVDTPYYQPALEHARERAERALREAEDHLGGVKVDLRMVEGPPARALVSTARDADADEIVVGSRGFGGVRAAALGSTSHALLHEADRPVIVLTPRAAERHVRRSAAGGAPSRPTTVVGWDGSDAARSALRYAAKRARGSGGTLLVVSAYEPPANFLGTPYYERALADSQARARELLAQLDREETFGVDIDTDLAEGPPAQALARAAAARDAREIVVGSRGLGRFRAALGSVSHELLHETDCAVVVVPRPEAADRDPPPA